MSLLGGLVSYCARNPLAVLAGTLALGAWGLFEAFRMPAQVLPELTRTTVTIMAEAPGMAPEEVETLVVLPIENAVRGTSGTQRVRTESIAGLGLIFVEFGWGEDPYRARQLVQERLRSVEEDMPEGVSAQMGPITSLLGEIMLVGLTSTDPDRSPLDLRTLAERDLVRPLQALPGVAQVLALGGGLAEYRIHALPDRMLAYGVTLDELIEAAGKAQGNEVGGFLENDSSEKMLRAIGRSSALHDFENTVVKKVDDRPVLVRDVAEVVMAPRPMRGDAQIEGRPAVILGVQKQPDADVREHDCRRSRSSDLVGPTALRSLLHGSLAADAEGDAHLLRDARKVAIHLERGPIYPRKMLSQFLEFCCGIRRDRRDLARSSISNGGGAAGRPAERRFAESPFFPLSSSGNPGNPDFSPESRSAPVCESGGRC